MSKTTILWLALYCGGLALALFHPFWALAAYMVDYYQHPPLRWWGRELPSDLRWSLAASAVLLGALLVKGYSPVGSATMRHPAARWLLAFCLIATLVTPFAVSTERSLHYLRQIYIFSLTYLMIVATLDSKERWRWLVALMAVGAFTWGWDAWRDPSREAGRLVAIGGPDSYNDNSAALHLLAVLPFLAVMLFYGRTWEKAVAGLSLPFTVNTIILCNSRGATVAIGMMGIAAMMLARGKIRLRIIGLIAAGTLIFLFLADPEFLERQVTIFSSAEERDGSAQSRLESWAGALDLMADYPLGAGGGGYDILGYIYIPHIVERAGGERAVHNTYLWIGSDWGIPGLTAYLLYLGTTFVALRRRERELGTSREAMECLAVQVSLVGICTGAFFINRVYGEIMYWIPALGAALLNVTSSAEDSMPSGNATNDSAVRGAADAAPYEDTGAGS